MILSYYVENWYNGISKNSSNGGGWKKFSKENVGNVSYVLKRKHAQIYLHEKKDDSRPKQSTN
jgi:hypothetical protein